MQLWAFIAQMLLEIAQFFSETQSTLEVLLAILIAELGEDRWKKKELELEAAVMKSASRIQLLI